MVPREESQNRIQRRAWCGNHGSVLARQVTIPTGLQFPVWSLLEGKGSVEMEDQWYQVVTLIEVLR